MKIALLFYALTVNGGSPRLYIEMAKALKDLGHEIRALAYYYDPHAFPEDLVEELDIQYCKKVSNASMHASFDVSSRIELAKGYFVHWRRWIQSLSNDSFDVINPYEAIAYRTALGMKKRIKDCKVVWHVADPASYVNKEGAGRLYDKNILFKFALDAFGRYDRTVVRQLDKVLIPNYKVKKLMDEYYGISSEVARTYGVDVDRFVPNHSRSETRKYLERQLEIPTEVPLALGVGILMWHRRIEDAISAVAKVNEAGHNLHYLVAGTSQTAPDYARYLKERVRELKAAKFIHFLDDRISEEKLVNLYNSCDIYLFPNDNQTWGLAPLEAMSVGKPVIVTTGAGVHEILRNGKTALIAHPRNPDNMAEKINLLLSDDLLRKEIAAAGQNFVRGSMSWKKCAQRLVNSFQNRSSEI